MKFIWVGTTKESFESIKSRYYELGETIEYKLELLERMERKILSLGTSTQADKPSWKGSHKAIVDKFVIYYSFSEDMQTCFIEYFKHSSQHY